MTSTYTRSMGLALALTCALLACTRSQPSAEPEPPAPPAVDRGGETERVPDDAPVAAERQEPAATPCAAPGCCDADADCDDGHPCTADDCESGACVHEFDYAPCDDGDPCTAADHCDGAGGCAGTVVDCEDGSACTVTTCDPATGGCRFDPVEDGLPCDDANDCTAGDACAWGTCVGETVCDCKTTADCLVHEDGDLCNGTLTCNGYVCVLAPGTAVTCPEAGASPCTTTECAPATGACENVPRPNGTACDAGDPCTTGDVCVSGSCTPQAPVPGCCHYDHECSDGDVCTDDHCDAHTCTHTDNLSPCDDGDACTTMDHCDGGGSCEGQPVACDDGDPCTSDLCDPATGACATEPAAVGRARCREDPPCPGQRRRSRQPIALPAASNSSTTNARSAVPLGAEG